MFTGSSSIEQWGTLPADFPRLRVVNRGIGGTGLADLLAFAPLLVYPLGPKLIVIYAGENDLAEGRTPEEIVRRFEQLCGQVRQFAPRARWLFLSLKPSPCRPELLGAVRDTNTRLAVRAARERHGTFVDVCTPMLGADGRARGELFVEDRLHLNAAGYQLWARILAPILLAH